MTRVLTFVTFNNKGFPKQRQRDVDAGDKLVRDQLAPDALMEQERWHPAQLPSFRSIFDKSHGYNTYSPVTLSGTICARKINTLQHLAHFSYLAHGTVPYICARRRFRGEVCKIVGTTKTLTYFSVHLTPSAFSNRFAEGSKRKKSAQAAWNRGMLRIRAFAERQLASGRDYVVIGGDFNAQRWRVERWFGAELAGKRVHVYTSPSGYNIDHIIVIGNARKISQLALEGTSSDHDPFAVVARFD